MENYSFIPSWYTERCIKKKNRLMNVLTSLILLVNILFLSSLWLNIGKMEDVKTKVSNLKVNTKPSADIKSENEKNSESLSVLSKFLVSLNGRLQYSHINISGKTMIIEFQCEGLDEYYNVVSLIESSGKYRIKQSSPVEFKVPINKIRLDIEVK